MAFFFTFDSPAKTARRVQLQADLEAAALQLKEAQRQHRAARVILERFNRGYEDSGSEPKEMQKRNGRTGLVKRAITVQQWKQFTPSELLATIQHVFFTEAHLCPDVNTITRVLIKLSQAGYIERISPGAGLKQPIYKAVRRTKPLTKTTTLPS